MNTKIETMEVGARRFRVRTAVAVIAASLLLPAGVVTAAPAERSTAAEVGYGVGSTFREIGHGARDLGREIGHGAADFGRGVGGVARGAAIAVGEGARAVGHAARDGSKALVRGIKGEGAPARDE